MSNVLIGILGVILFIGLALAGALFLGPRFQESTNTSRAAAAVQSVSQISSAASMYQVQEGRNDFTLDAAVGTGLLNGYLKSVPSNPTGGAAPIISADGHVEMELGGNAELICKAIQKQMTGEEVVDATIGATVASEGPAGCVGATGAFKAFARI